MARQSHHLDVVECQQLFATSPEGHRICAKWHIKGFYFLELSHPFDTYLQYQPCVDEAIMVSNAIYDVVGMLMYGGTAAGTPRPAINVVLPCAVFENGRGLLEPQTAIMLF